MLLFSYGTLSAWSPSTVRAVLMIGLSVAARLLDLRYDMLTALSAAALLLIARNPYVILGTAFQMSFLAISSIAFFQRILPQKVPESLTTALADKLGLVLYQAYQFHTISLISLAANLPILYLTGYFVPFAMGCFALSGCAGGSLFSLCLSFLEAMAQMLLRINAWFGLNGHAAIEVMRPPIWLTILLLGGAFFAASETCLLLRLRKQNKQLVGCVGLILLLALAVQLFTYSPITHDDLIFVDVGQGDAIHLRSHGSQILIDGGGNVRYDVGSKTLKPYFLGNGVRKLDLALATHRHTDHYLGQCQLAETFPVKQQLAGLTAGKEIRFGRDDQVWIEVLWPLTLAEDPQQEGNAACSVFLLHYDGYRVLITGDLDEEGELELPVPDGLRIQKNYVGANIQKYDSMLVLSHFKGHPMGGFGGALKNISIGPASSHGKAYIHGAGKVEEIWTADHDSFLESMADAAKSITDYFGDKLVFINVMKNMSVDCDCCAIAEDPAMVDIGILASTDPVALDQACLDLVYQSDDPGRNHLIERIESRNGVHTVEAAEARKAGTREYELIEIG